MPIVGDDIKSQVGATIVHRVLANLFRERGVRLDRTYQLNFGGNTDFQNMLERERLESKKISKTQAVTSQLDMPLPAEDVHVGPSDYVPWLTDRKWAYIRMEGTTFGGVPLNVELKLEVWDSPNSAGIVIDAVRCAKLGARPRHRRRADRPLELLHEVAAAAVHGQRGAASAPCASSPATMSRPGVHRGDNDLHLVRHAAHDRVGDILCGRMPGVTLGGRAGAGRADRRAARRRGIAAVYSSPLERARDRRADRATGSDRRSARAR